VLLFPVDFQGDFSIVIQLGAHATTCQMKLFHVILGQLQPSLILVEQIRTVDKAYLRNKVGEVKHSKMEEVEASIRTWMDI